MVLYSDLKNWQNDNILDIDRPGLISIARYFEGGAMESDIEYDMQTDAEYTDEYLSSLQEDRANEANERAIHIGEHGGELNE